MGDEGGDRWRLRFVGFISRRNLTDIWRHSRRESLVKASLNQTRFVSKKNVLLRKFWKDGEKGVVNKDLRSLILCCIKVNV